MDDYNQGWSGSYSAYGSYPHIVIWRGMWRMKNISATHLLPQTDRLEAKMSSLSNLFDRLFEAIRNWCMMNASVEESVEHDVHKSEEEVPYVNVEHDELKDDFHQKLEIRELCIELDKVVDNPVPIDVEIEATSVLVEKLIMENTELVEKLPFVNELYVKLERQNMAAGHPTVVDMSDSLPQSIKVGFSRSC
ncbi:hypothetical protein J1N35_014277 [Gossypium stocksii]|uniref:Uncharacterized protein n=1 Tax=Gossypium stocksii TaxID=47602 RepID=A0A9D4A9K4_9ROSI|nr:hypothetical protein J1N35_014277 [Gossypium stocksii]